MSSFRAPPINRKIPLLFALIGTLATGCADISLGQGTQNDPVPTGTIVAQGNFTGVNGHSVTGTVAIYQQISGSTCNFVVRLQNLSAPSDAGLQVLPVINGAPALTPTFYTLRGPTGNENYNFSNANCSTTWAQVQISNPAVSPPTAQNYGVATLTHI